MLKKCCLIAVGGFVALVVIIVILMIVASQGDDNELEQVAIVANVTVGQLFAEREENATRFDDTYMDKYVHISGTVLKVDQSTVYLVDADELRRESLLLQSLGLGSTGLEDLLDKAALADLPRDVQASVNREDTFSAVCKVGNFGFTSMNFSDCRLPE